jgi:transposase
MGRDKLTDREREERRKQAVEAIERGFDRHKVAEIFGVTPHAVWEWVQIYDEQGMSGLEKLSQSKRYLKNTSSDRLFNMLSEAEDSKATQKIMIALIYNEFKYANKYDISKIFNISEPTVRNWLTEIDEVSEKSINPAIKEFSGDKNSKSFELEPRKRTRRELAVRRKEAVTLLSRGFSAERVSWIFDVSKNTVRIWKQNYQKDGWEGLEDKAYSTNNSNRFQNMSIEYLLNILSEVDKSKPAQKIMLAINYKKNNYMTQKDISERYNLGRKTVNEWFSHVEQCKYLRPEKALREKYHIKHNINQYEIPDKTNRELNVLRKETIRLLSRGFSIERVSEIFDFSTDDIQRWAKIYEENGWKGLDSAKLNANESTEETENDSRIKCVEIGELYSELNNIRDYPTLRLVAGILYKKGATIPEITDLIDVHPTTIDRWFDEMEKKPIAEAVQRDSVTGRPMKLSEDKFSELEEFLREGADSHGFVGQLWTGKRVAKVIEEQFGVSVSPSTARSYLRKLGWSNKKPQRRSTKRDEEEIEAFKSEMWEEIRQEGKKQNKPIVFVDETKFRIMPTFKSTWAPVGETPTVETSGLFEYVAVIGALVYNSETNGMDFHWKSQRYNFKTKNIRNFLHEIVEKLSQEPIFLLDNLAAHTSAINEIKDDTDEKSPQVEWFPEYASDINPVDNVWGHAKYNELANYAPKDLDELESKVDETLSYIRTDDSVLRYCIKDAGLEIGA